MALRTSGGLRGRCHGAAQRLVPGRAHLRSRRSRGAGCRDVRHADRGAGTTQVAQGLPGVDGRDPGGEEKTVDYRYRWMDIGGDID